MRWAVLGASVLAACSAKTPVVAGKGSGSGSSAVTDPWQSSRVAPARTLPIAQVAPVAPGLLQQQQQLITAITDDWQATQATLQLWQRDDQGHWQTDGASWPGVIGKTGTAWGIGLHGNGVPALPPGVAATGTVKAEGDQRSPAGAFELGNAYGYAEGEQAKLRYAAVGPSWRCVDDSASVHYNQVLDTQGINVDWRSAEIMRRNDALYTLVIETKHNAVAQAGAGSCIFLHVWRDTQSPTVGCTAMPQDRLRWLLGKLDPAKRPAFVLLPRSVYAELAATWDLPNPGSL